MTMHQSIGLSSRTARFSGGFFAAVLWLTPTWVVAETLKIAGTGGDLGAMRMLGDAFQALHPDIDVEVLPGLGSSGGICGLFVLTAWSRWISAMPDFASAHGVTFRA